MFVFMLPKFKQDLLTLSVSSSLDVTFAALHEYYKDEKQYPQFYVLSQMFDFTYDHAVFVYGQEKAACGIDQYSTQDRLREIITLVNTPEFRGKYGNWIVADGTEYIEHRPNDVDEEFIAATFVFIPEPQIPNISDLMRN